MINKNIKMLVTLVAASLAIPAAAAASVAKIIKCVDGEVDVSTTTATVEYFKCENVNGTSIRLFAGGHVWAGEVTQETPNGTAIKLTPLNYRAWSCQSCVCNPASCNTGCSYYALPGTMTARNPLQLTPTVTNVNVVIIYKSTPWKCSCGGGYCANPCCGSSRTCYRGCRPWRLCRSRCSGCRRCH